VWTFTFALCGLSLTEVVVGQILMVAVLVMGGCCLAGGMYRDFLDVGSTDFVGD